MDNKFQKLNEFIHNMKFKHEGISNVYLFETVDADGNVTDTKYGMNLMTNIGFAAIYKNAATFDMSAMNLYVGTFTGEITVGNTAIIDLAFQGLAATKSNNTKDYEFPIIYAPGLESDTGIITLVSRFGIVYYPENIQDYDFDVAIAEYGLGTAWNNLYTHSHVYNNTGEISAITKKSGDKLFIYVYTCLSLYEHVIMNAWQNQTYIALTTNAIMFQRFFMSNMGTYKRAAVTDRTSSGITKSIDDVTVEGTYRSISLLQEFTMADSYGATNGYIDGFYGSAPGLKIIDKQYLPKESGVQQTEAFTLTGYKAVDPLNTDTPEDAINMNIGKNITTQGDWNKTLYPQFTTMLNIDVKTYNFHEAGTDKWTNAVQFYNDNDYHYSNAGFETAYATPIYYWSNNLMTMGYLYLNIFPENPILKINSGHPFVYATDKYWDLSSWVPITNFDSIPASVQSAKYWITGNNTLAIVPVRQKHGFELLDPVTGDNGFRNINALGEPTRGSRPSVDNVAYNFITIGGEVYTLSHLAHFTFDSSNYMIRPFTYGRWLIATSENSTRSRSIRCIDMTHANDNNVDPNMFTTMKTLGFTADIDAYRQVYISETNTGWLCFQGLKSGVRQCVIWDLRSDPIVEEVHTDWDMSTAIFNSNYVAYHKSGEALIHIYNLSTGADDGVAITTPNTTVSAIYGVGHTLWFSNNSATYYVDLSTPDRIATACSWNGLNNTLRDTNLYSMRVSGTSDVLMLYKDYPNISYDLSTVIFLNANNPAAIKDMSGISRLGSQNTSVCGRIRYVGNTLFCLYALSDNILSGTLNNSYYMFDLGRYITDGSAAGHFRGGYNGTYSAYLYGNYIFKNVNKMFPIVNALPLKITGNTKTITSTNVLKHIKNKTYILGYTNAPLWGTTNLNGKPPGKPDPVTNAGGMITGWVYA